MENNQQIKNQAITRQEDDFAQWYTDVCKKAELMDYSSVKGFIIYRPYGYAIWEEIQNYLNKRFKETGHQNVYMPTVIPTSLLQREKDHIEGFAPECLIANIGGGQEIDDPLIITPTSETLFCEHYAKIINSYRDLPKLYNQWRSVVRWEKTTRPFLRGAEFLWQEGHTMHETEEEARTETLKMLEIYDDLGRDILAIPFTKGRKTEKEKFAGALETYSIEALMPDGKALQSGTTHYFGQGFAKAFGIQFQGRLIKSGAHIVVGTPGRVLDVIKRGALKINNIQWLVLDEADEMLNMGFQEDLDNILSNAPDTKQTLLFSATMPDGVRKIAMNYMHDAEEIAVGKKNSGPPAPSSCCYTHAGECRTDCPLLPTYDYGNSNTDFANCYYHNGFHRP